MLILPRSNPLYEHIPTHKIKLPEVLVKMGTGGFTGYLGYAAAEAESYALFSKGILISILFMENERRKTGFEAISALFDHNLSHEGQCNVYRMTPDLTMCTHALLHGDMILQPQEVRTVDLKTVLGRMKMQALNGTVLFTAAERSALIFYKEGAVLGFYHDAAREIEASPVESQKIAALPGARVEIRGCPSINELMHHNLLEMVNIDRLWEAACTRSAGRQTPSPEAAEQTSEPDTRLEILDEIIDDLREIAAAYLGKQGAALVNQALEREGGGPLLFDQARTDRFLSVIATEVSSVDPDAKIEEMTDLMRSEIAGRLAV